MRFDEGPPRAAPAHFPYRDHGTLADVWGIAPEPAPTVSELETVPEPKPARATPALRECVKLSLDNEERLARMSAEKAFERYSRGEW